MHHPGLKPRLLDSALSQFMELRDVPGLKKKPSTSEFLDWLKLILAEDLSPEDLARDPATMLPKLHGALLDAELLADVYLAMTRGQNALSMDVEVEESNGSGLLEAVALAEVIVVRASAEELTAHAELLGGLDKQVKGQCIWRNYAEA